MPFSIRTILASVLSVTLLGAAVGEARELRYAIGFPPGSTGSRNADAFAERVSRDTGGALTIGVFPQSLLSFTEMSDGVRDGIADLGFVIGSYAPNLYPSLNMAGESTMISNLTDFNERSGLAWTGTVLEFVMLNCPKCQDEFLAQNQVFTSTASSEFYLMCRKPVRTREDIRGLSIRTPGAHWSRWAVAADARSASVPTQESFEALTQGILDCTMGNPAELVNLSLIDAVKHITRVVPGGGFASAAQTNFNLDVWRSLSLEERSALLKASAFISADLAVNYYQESKTALDLARQRGIEILDPDPEFLAWTQDFTRKDVEALAQGFAEKHGLTDAADRMVDLNRLYAKWSGLVDGIETTGALETLFWDEVLSKVDPATYGM